MANGKGVPVTKLKVGKKINFIKIKMNTSENSHPLKLSSFHKRNQNLFHNFFKFINKKRRRSF
jgi:hypothetical protein